MATFPGAVFTRAAINTGQTSTPADVNDLASEITAIEDALVNGPTALQHVTTVGLQVTGNSTLGSTIAFGTNTYIFSTAVPGSTGQVLAAVGISGSTVTVGWRSQSGSSNVNYVRVGSTTPFQIADNLETVVTNWTRNDLDGNSFHSTSGASTVTSKLVVPVGASGVYNVISNVFFSAIGAPAASYIYVDGVNVQQNTLNVAAGNAIQNTGLFRLDAGQKVECGVYNNSGSTSRISTLSSFGMVKVGA